MDENTEAGFRSPSLRQIVCSAAHSHQVFVRSRSRSHSPFHGLVNQSINQAGEESRDGVSQFFLSSAKYLRNIEFPSPYLGKGCTNLTLFCMIVRPRFDKHAMIEWYYKLRFISFSLQTGAVILHPVISAGQYCRGVALPLILGTAAAAVFAGEIKMPFLIITTDECCGHKLERKYDGGVGPLFDHTWKRDGPV